MSVRVLLNGGREVSEQTPHGSYTFELSAEASGKALTIVDESGKPVGSGRFSIDSPAIPARVEQPPAPMTYGPGSMFARLAALFGFKETEECDCRNKRILLDKQGWLWVLRHPARAWATVTR